MDIKRFNLLNWYWQNYHWSRTIAFLKSESFHLLQLSLSYWIRIGGAGWWSIGCLWDHFHFWAYSCVKCWSWLVDESLFWLPVDCIHFVLKVFTNSGNIQLFFSYVNCKKNDCVTFCKVNPFMSNSLNFKALLIFTCFHQSKHVHIDHFLSWRCLQSYTSWTSWEVG